MPSVWYLPSMQQSGPTVAGRPLLIANPAAGRGRTGHALPHLVAAVRDAVGDLVVAETRRRGDAERLAAAAVREGRPLVVGLGGDGTLNEIANGLLGQVPEQPGDHGGAELAAKSPERGLPALGIVGTGTGGDYGRSLGIPHESRAYLAALRGGAERAVDVGRARYAGPDGRPCRRFWLNVLSAGIGGLVDRYTASAPALLGGRLAYAQATVRAIVVCRRARLRCRYTDPDGTPRERLLDAHAVAVCNGRTFGGGMNIAPMARLDDGVLEVVAFETRTRARLISRFMTVYAGTHLVEPGISHFRCLSLELEPETTAGRRPRAGLFPLDVDGDALGDVPLRLDVAPGALRVRAPLV